MDEITFDVTIEDLLYQKFLLQICKICDDIYFTEKKILEIPFDEKERMAEEMLEFVAYSLNNLKSSLVRVKKKPRDFDKKLEKFSKILSKKADEDKFVKFVLLKYILERRVEVKKIPSNMALATLALLTKDKRVTLKELSKEIRRIKPFTLRVAALISPFIELYKKLQDEVRGGKVDLDTILKEGKIDKETLRYIG